MRTTVPTVDADGYAFASAVLSEGEVTSIRDALESTEIAGAGSRNLLQSGWCRELVEKIRHHSEIRAALPTSPVAVQCTFFDKSEEKNWLVALHQDLAIPVKERVEDVALGVWSVREGQHFVQAPAELLEQLLAVRVHVDDCGLENGPLKVVPGSHRHGRLDEVTARSLRDAAGEIACAISSGGALLLRPLLLHASSKAKSPRHRRVLHFLFGPEAPGYGLRWQHAV
jgi:ectoine hydroxylase-related dioxygenase (phytanoyl-CoA dioxygenase family)